MSSTTTSIASINREGRCGHVRFEDVARGLDSKDESLKTNLNVRPKPS